MIAPNELASARPEWIDSGLIEETKAAWSPFYGRTLTTAEAIEILLDVGRLIDVIQERNQ